MSSFEKAMAEMKKQGEKSLDTTRKFFNYYKKSNNKIVFKIFAYLYEERFMSLPFYPGYYGNLLAVALLYRELDIAKFLIENSNVKTDMVSHNFYFKDERSADYWIKNLMCRVQENDRIRLNELSEIIKEKNKKSELHSCDIKEQDEFKRHRENRLKY